MIFRPIVRWWHFQQSRWRRFWSSLTFGRLGRRIGSWIGTLWFIIKYPFYITGRFFVALWNGMRAAWTQQYIRHFLQGLPALIALVAIGITSAFAYLRGGEGLIDLYSREGQLALGSGQIKKAQLCFERLLQLSPKDQEAKFYLSEALSNQPGFDAQTYAQTLLTDLAPLDRGDGFPRAHFYEARRMLMRGATTRDILNKAELHLRRSMNPAAVPPLKDREALEARALLGRVLLAQGKEAEAEPYLVRAAPAIPDLRMLLSVIYRKAGRTELAVDQARVAANYYKGLAEANLDDVAARIQWARALLLMEEYEQAVQVLNAGYGMVQDQGYRYMLSEAFREWAVKTRTRRPQALDEFLGLLQQSISASPSNPNSIGLLVDLIRSQTPEALKAKETLRSLLAQNGNSPLLHFAVGVVAYEEDPNSPTARFHWEQAFKLDYDWSIAGNNLAWHLANVPPLELERALEISTAVCEKNPDIGLFHGTRGYILAQMGRYREAITDLEKSVKDNERNPELNKYLAECYEKLGNKAMAEEHLRLHNFKLRALQESTTPPK